MKFRFFNKIYAINDSQNSDVFEIFLSLEANYQNLTEWLERLESQKSSVCKRMNVKIWQPQMFSQKFKLI